MAATTSTSAIFPEPFRDLEPFGDWVFETEVGWQTKRESSGMPEIQAFYDALLPRFEAAVGYLNQFPLDEMPDDAQRLFHLLMAWVDATSAVERYRNPSVTTGVEASRFQRTA